MQKKTKKQKQTSKSYAIACTTSQVMDVSLINGECDLCLHSTSLLVSICAFYTQNQSGVSHDNLTHMRHVPQFGRQHDRSGETVAACSRRLSSSCAIGSPVLCIINHRAEGGLVFCLLRALLISTGKKPVPYFISDSNSSRLAGPVCLRHAYIVSNLQQLHLPPAETLRFCQNT